MADMRCPSCSNCLTRIKVWSYFIETCSDCGGIWLEAENFGDFVRGLAASQNVPSDVVELFKRRDVLPPHKIKEQTKLCPKCRKKLLKSNYAYDSNVILDKCPECGGIWADKGEVERAARYLKWADKGEVERAASYLKGDPRPERSLVEIQKLAHPEIDPDDVYPGDYLGQLRIILPWSDDTPRRRFPAVTVSIISVCTAAFLAYVCLDKPGYLEKFKSVPGAGIGTQILGWMFLSNGPLYFVLNMLFLWLFGDNVEDRFSRLGYLTFYICCGLFAGFVYSIFKHDLSIATIGVGGAVSGIMGAYFIFYPVANVSVFVFCRTVEVPAVLFLGLWFLFQLLSPFLFKGAPVLNAAWPAHVSGFVFGMLVALFMKGRVKTAG